MSPTDINFLARSEEQKMSLTDINFRQSGSIKKVHRRGALKRTKINNKINSLTTF